jgi:hypothetical protein
VGKKNRDSVPGVRGQSLVSFRPTGEIFLGSSERFLTFVRNDRIERLNRML